MELRYHQHEAVEVAGRALADGGRAQLSVACGSGKTLTAPAAAERLAPAQGGIVQLTPTIALVAQTAQFWAQHADLDGMPEQDPRTAAAGYQWTAAALAVADGADGAHR
ncbi:DEAD/DEAH box helicase family protein [Kitasatospora sp. NPDC006697]|uniref:DEAD/DEAH box helicase family protein n=1 Tax=Kitasatospora sp. NPDC006697 TaxID=3364020 RepID=UPI0036A6DF1F